MFIYSGGSGAGAVRFVRHSAVTVIIRSVIVCIEQSVVGSLVGR